MPRYTLFTLVAIICLEATTIHWLYRLWAEQKTIADANIAHLIINVDFTPPKR